jgi:hypothetical protein
VVEPGVFELLFVMNSLFPKRTEDSMCKPG